MIGIKAIPRAVVFACMLTVGYPLYAADRYHKSALLPQTIGLPRVEPVGVEQEPRWTLLAEDADQLMQDGSGPWWIGDEACDIVDQSSSSILTFDLGGAWLYVPCGDTDMSFVFEVPNQVARPGTRLTEPRLRRKPR